MRKKFLTLALALGLFVTSATGIAAHRHGDVDEPVEDETEICMVDGEVAEPHREPGSDEITGPLPDNPPCTYADDDIDDDEPIR